MPVEMKVVSFTYADPEEQFLQVMSNVLNHLRYI